MYDAYRDIMKKKLWILIVAIIVIVLVVSGLIGKLIFDNIDGTSTSYTTTFGQVYDTNQREDFIYAIRGKKNESNDCNVNLICYRLSECSEAKIELFLPEKFFIDEFNDYVRVIELGYEYKAFPNYDRNINTYCCGIIIEVPEILWKDIEVVIASENETLKYSGTIYCSVRDNFGRRRDIESISVNVKGE